MTAKPVSQQCPRCHARCVVQDCREKVCLACGFALEEAPALREFPCAQCSAVFRNEGEFASHKAWHAGNQAELPGLREALR